MYPENTATQPTEAPNNLVDYLDWKWKTNEKYTRERCMDYYDSIAFYLDHQWQHWTTSNDSYTPLPSENVESGKIYSVTNLIKPLADSRIAKILGNKPILEVVSEEKSSEAIQRADNNTKILKALWLDLNMQSVLTHFVKWMVITNHCFLRPYYNPEFGRIVPNPQYDETMASTAEELGYEYNEEPTMTLGRIGVDIFNGLQTIFDTSKPTWRDVIRYGWVEMKYLKNLYDLRGEYGKKKCSNIKPEAEGSTGSIEEQLLNLTRTGSLDSRKSDNRYKDKEAVNVNVYEYYEAPSHRFPKGLHCVKCQDESLYDSRDTGEELPNGRIPVFMGVDQPGMETLWAKSLVSGSRHKQKQFNVLRSRVIEHTRLPCVYAFSEDSGIDTDNLPGQSYIVCKYDSQSGPPLIVSPPPIPQTVLYEMETIKGDMVDYWGQQGASAQQAESPKVSGRARFLSMSGDVEKIGTTMGLFGETLSDYGEALLWLAKKHYTEKRSGHFPGLAGKMETIEFTGSQDILEDYSVKVTIGSDFQRNRESMMQFIVQLLGVLAPFPAIVESLNDKMVFHKLLSFVSDEFANILMTKNQDAGEAEWENRQMLEGKNPPVRPYHKHPVHIKILMSLMTSQEFRDLEERRQEEIVQTHLVKHLEYLQQGMKSQMMAQQGVPPDGQPPGGGGGMAFQQAAGPTDPIQAVDAALESQVNPSGRLGAEEIP